MRWSLIHLFAQNESVQPKHLQLDKQILNIFVLRGCSQDGTRREARKIWTGRSSSARGRTRSGSGSWRSSGSKLSPRNASASNVRRNDEDVSMSSDRVITTGLLIQNAIVKKINFAKNLKNIVTSSFSLKEVGLTKNDN